MLKDIRFDIKQGSLVAVLGATGAGKSTLVNCLNGMDVSGVEGEVTYSDINILNPENFRKVRESIGSIPQENILHQERTVYRELLAAAKDRLPEGTSKEHIEGNIERALEKLKISHRKNAVIGAAAVVKSAESRLRPNSSANANYCFWTNRKQDLTNLPKRTVQIAAQTDERR